MSAFVSEICFVLFLFKVGHLYSPKTHTYKRPTKMCKEGKVLIRKLCTEKKGLKCWCIILLLQQSAI